MKKFAISITFCFLAVFALAEDSLNVDITKYYKYSPDRLTVLDKLMPLSKASDFLSILRNRKLVDIDTKAEYVFLYSVETVKGTTNLTGKILFASDFKENAKSGIDLSKYKCRFGVCNRKDDCGTNQFIGYEGGYVVWVNSCGNMSMYISAVEGNKVVGNTPIISSENESAEPEKQKPDTAITESPKQTPEPGRFD